MCHVSSMCAAKSGFVLSTTGKLTAATNNDDLGHFQGKRENRDASTTKMQLGMHIFNCVRSAEGEQPQLKLITGCTGYTGNGNGEEG